MNSFCTLRSTQFSKAGWRMTLLLIALLFGWPLAHAEESYTFAVVPQFEQRKLFATWKPIIDELSRRTGITLNLVATQSVSEFERELSRGRYDFVYSNPYHILRELTRQGYVPLVCDQTPLRGILVVRKDSPIKTPTELDGAKLAIPSFNALGASLLLRADLEQIYKAKPLPVDVKTHSSVYLQVANGLLPAGGGVEKTLSEQDRTVQAMLRVLYTTREMPSHPVAAHPRLPAGVRQALQRALLDLASSEDDKKLLLHVPMTNPVATSMQDYTPMKKWGLEAYWVD